MGLGRGRGFWHPGFHFPYWPPFCPPSREEELAMLEDQAKILEKQLEQISARLNDLGKAGKEKTNEE
jgi:hypothetical protein